LRVLIANVYDSLILNSLAHRYKVLLDDGSPIFLSCLWTMCNAIFLGV